MISHIPNPNVKMQQYALKKDIESVKYIKPEVDHSLQMEIVKEDPKLIKHIKHPTPEVVEF